jgi:hypothetical protein
MATHATGTFEVTSWNEERYLETDEGIGLSRATVTQRFSGDITGDGSVEYLMAYRENGGADVIGLQRVVGRIGDRRGSFVLQVTGAFDGKEVHATWFVVDGTGTDDLRGLRGDGTMVAPLGPEASITLDYEL